ncbi:MAG: bacteriocin [Firmicutes bacterium]|nr:bacteriocin [Bacillota bacterium]
MMSDEKKLTDEQLNNVSGGAGSQPTVCVGDSFEGFVSPTTNDPSNGPCPFMGSDYTKDASWGINGNNESTRTK